MFRNPRENASRSRPDHISPSVGRPPSPPPKPNGQSSSPQLVNSIPTMATKSATSSPLSASTPNARPQHIASGVASLKGKAKSQANGSILSFFKKVDSINGRGEELFFGEKGKQSALTLQDEDRETMQDEAEIEGLYGASTPCHETRFNETNGAVKRRKLSSSGEENGDLNDLYSVTEESGAGGAGCSPPPPGINDERNFKGTDGSAAKPSSRPARNGPFFQDSDSEEEEPSTEAKDSLRNEHDFGLLEQPEKARESLVVDMDTTVAASPPPAALPSSLKHEATSYGGEDGFADFEGMGDFNEYDYEDGDEYVERKYMLQQRRLELQEQGFEGDFDEDEFEAISPEYENIVKLPPPGTGTDSPTCPICGVKLEGISDQEASVHVNNCIDGNPTPLSTMQRPVESTTGVNEESSGASKFKRPIRPAKPGQENPFALGSASGTSSAFSKLMSGHAEDAAWATAAAAENAARGKPAYQRTCPFYKILPGFYTCVDAFRYGAVQGCNAYFLSHFHSDHYVGLTSSWCHGPIYCSRPTANLVKQQLRVDPQWVVELEFEKKVEVPRTDGVFVIMIPANHCPGSSLFLFEKTIGKGKTPRIQRVLHCGDFRACPAHVEHPLLRPEVLDTVTGKTAQQKLDVCYLDTTYLNPKYAFPSQEDIIQACADMCVSMNKDKVDKSDLWEQAKEERAGTSMASFVRRDSKDDDSKDADKQETYSNRGRLLVVVGTYSIGKERICLGIARALDSLIYAPPGKQRICACLEDPELNARLTSDPRAAQVHMTPLFEIRAETLSEYLADYRDRFSRAVGFRPSGWNYRPPGSRFTESPAVNTVLYSDNWKSSYSIKDLVPQRGSTSKAACFGVPYSEHSSFRELTMFCCALRIEKIIPTVNIGSAKSRERMKLWCERWATERKKNGLFRPKSKDDDGGKSAWYPRKGTMELRTTL